MFMSASMADTIQDEAYLISEFRRGKTRAFEQIFFKFHGAICYFAQEFINDPESAKDIVSEIFIKVWNLKHDFDSVRSIKAFLYISTKNACLNYLRRVKMMADHEKLVVQEQETADLGPAIMHRIFDTEVLREVHFAIDGLPSQCKRVMKLTLQGLNTDDIASMMNLSSQTVRNTRVRATELLKKRLAHSVAALSILAAIVGSTRL